MIPLLVRAEGKLMGMEWRVINYFEGLGGVIV
jgi:hypothetical protein